MSFTPHYDHHRRRMLPDARVRYTSDPIIDGLTKQIAYRNADTRAFMFKAVSFVAMGCALAAAWQTFAGIGGQDR